LTIGSEAFAGTKLEEIDFSQAVYCDISDSAIPEGTKVKLPFYQEI
jgi:hypothetical protein